MFWALSAVQVVMMSASRTASSTVVTGVMRKPSGSRLRITLSTAAGSVSWTVRSSMPMAARKPSAWNSDCEPVPIRAIRRESLRARCLATIAETAAVRRAVSSVISARKVG